MKEQMIFMSHGGIFKPPLFDPIVSQHWNKESSHIGTLIDQINSEHTYTKLFAFKKDLVFLDIGANAGLVSIYASQSCKRIVAIEPSPVVFPVLKAMTLGMKNIECHDVALSPRREYVDFYLNDINSTASSTVNTYGTKITVQGLTLNDMIRVYQLEHVDVCKLDAEGAEGESLSFSELAEASSVIRTYYIETHNCPKNTWEYKLGILVSHLSKMGYHKQEINGMALIATKP